MNLNKSNSQKQEYGYICISKVKIKNEIKPKKLIQST